MRILNGNEWQYEGIHDGGFVFRNIRYPDVNERLIISVCGLEIEGTRIYFEIVDSKFTARVPKRKSISPSFVSRLFGKSMRDLVETETSYFVSLAG